MPQTIGAFFAIILVMVFAINFSQSKLESQRKQVSAELETMASAIATDVMQSIASKNFDSEIQAGVVTRNLKNVDQLTPAGKFGGQTFDTAADIDDYHNMPADTVLYTTQSGDQLPFSFTVSVNYVDAYGSVSPSPTWIKEVAVHVKGPPDPDQELLANPVVLRRQFSPSWY